MHMLTHVQPGQRGGHLPCCDSIVLPLLPLLCRWAEYIKGGKELRGRPVKVGGWRTCRDNGGSGGMWVWEDRLKGEACQGAHNVKLQ
jgi:hypothetical protein